MSMRANRQRGVAAIELAILMIPLMILGAGMFEVGRAFYNYNQLVSTTRDAARYLSMQAHGQGEPYARCLAAYANPTCTGEPVVHGLTAEMVHIDYESAVPTGEGSVDLVRVTVEGYPYVSIFEAVLPSLAFAPIGTTMRQAAS